MLVYLRDGSSQICVGAVKQIKKLQINFVCLFSFFVFVGGGCLLCFGFFSGGLLLLLLLLFLLLLFWGFLQMIISFTTRAFPQTSKLFSERAQRTSPCTPPPPPPPPQESSTMVPKCTSGCPEHNLICSPDSHWDALELQPFAKEYPLTVTRALTERRSLMRHLNHLYIIVL